MNKYVLANTEIIRGISWKSAGQIFQNISQLIFTIFLARILDTSDYGLMAMALVFNKFIISMTNFNFGTAINQSLKINKNQISTFFYMTFGINLILSLISYYGAGLVGSFFNEPALAPIIRVMASILFLKSFQFPYILLSREMNFKTISIIEILSIIIGNVIGLYCAIRGYGVWSLVMIRLVHVTTSCVFLTLIYKWYPSLPTLKGMHSKLKFASFMFGSNLVYFFSSHLSDLVIGKAVGKEALGAFSIARNIASLPSNFIKNNVSSVLLIAFSKIQKDIKQFKEKQSETLYFFSILFIPPMIILFSTSTNFINVIYGAKWTSAVPFLQILSIVAIFEGLSHFCRSAIISKGKSNIIFFATIIEVVAQITLIYILINKYNIYGICISLLISSIINFVFVAHFYDLIYNEKFNVLKQVLPNAFISTLFIPPIYALTKISINIYLSFTIQLIVAFILYLIFLYIARKKYLNNSLLKTNL